MNLTELLGLDAEPPAAPPNKVDAVVANKPVSARKDTAPAAVVGKTVIWCFRDGGRNIHRGIGTIVGTDVQKK